MGFLDKKERIFDIVLTEKGRELLSKNKLNIKYYSFSDVGVDYLSSLSSSAVMSGNISLSDYIQKEPLLEADNRSTQDPNQDVVGNRLGEGLDMNTFLFNSSGKTLPKFILNIDGEGDIELKRAYYYDSLDNVVNIPDDQQPDAILYSADSEREFTDTPQNYGRIQKLKSVDNNVKIGVPITPEIFSFDENSFYDTKAKKMIPRENITNLSSDFLISEDSKGKIVEIVESVDEKNIIMSIKKDTKTVRSKNGYLVEIFLSGTDGRLVKLPKETIEDVQTGEVLQEGYSKFLDIEVDK